MPDSTIIEPGSDRPLIADLEGNIPAVPTTRTSEPSAAYRGSGGTGRVARRTTANLDLSQLELARVDPFQLLDLLIDISPDVGKAMDNQLRLGNPGWTLVCRSVRGNDDPVATRIARDMLSMCARGLDAFVPGAMGGPDAFINTLLLHGFSRGAMCAETVLTDDLQNFYDLVVVDPLTIEFQEDPSRPGRYKIAQRQRGQSKPVELNPNFLTYIPVDDDLYGRSPIAPALQIIPFWIRFYADLQVYLHNAAWGFLDGEVDIDKLMENWNSPNFPARVKKDFSDNFLRWAMQQVRNIRDDYQNQAKDVDAFLAHLSVLKINVKNRGNNVFPVKDVVEMCKAEIFNALKQLPIFMGSNEGTTESFAQVQLAIFHSGLKRYQKMVKHIIERALQVGFMAIGYPKRVVFDFRFEGVPAEDQLKIARAKEIENRTLVFQRDNRWISNDEASMVATGSAALPGFGDFFVPYAGDQPSQTNAPPPNDVDNETDEDGEETNAEFDDTRTPND